LVSVTTEVSSEDSVKSTAVWFEVIGFVLDDQNLGWRKSRHSVRQRPSRRKLQVTHVGFRLHSAPWSLLRGSSTTSARVRTVRIGPESARFGWNSLERLPLLAVEDDANALKQTATSRSEDHSNGYFRSRIGQQDEVW
jgi:hypothetical protein